METTQGNEIPFWKRLLYRVPFATSGYNRLSRLTFRNSLGYWETRYAKGGNSGAGSRGRLAEFKAEILNGFAAQHSIQSVIEFGCGDGGQLELANYPSYLGLDVSQVALRGCIERFRQDTTKSFYLYDPFCFQDHRRVFTAELGLSLDVVYHLVEDEIFERYMQHVFASATRFVIVYSSNSEEANTSAHVRHRCVTEWVSKHVSEYRMLETIANRYPFDPANPTETTPADFFIFERTASHPNCSQSTKDHEVLQSN